MYYSIRNEDMDISKYVLFFYDLRNVGSKSDNRISCCNII